MSRSCIPPTTQTTALQNGANCRRTVCFFAHSVADLRTDPGHSNLARKGSGEPGRVNAGDAAPARDGGGGDERCNMERTASDAGAAFAAATGGAAAAQGAALGTTTAGALPAPGAAQLRRAGSGASAGTGSPGSAATAASRMQARAQAQAQQAARMRRESAPTRLMEPAVATAASPGDDGLGPSACDVYLSGGAQIAAAAARSLSLPATPHLARASSLGSTYGRSAAARGGRGFDTAAAAAAGSGGGGECWWGAAAVADGDGGGSLFGSAAGGPASPGGAYRPTGGASTAAAVVAAAQQAAALAQLLGGPTAAAAYLEGQARQSLQDQATVAAALRAAAAAGPYGEASQQGPYSQGLLRREVSDAAGGSVGAASQQLVLLQAREAARLQAARSVSSDAASIAAAAAFALNSSSSLDSSFSGALLPFGAPSTPTALRSPGTALGRGGSAAAGFYDPAGVAGGFLASPLRGARSAPSVALQRSASLAAAQRDAAGGGLLDGGAGMLDIPEAPHVGPSVSSPLLQPVPASPPAAGRLGMLSPMAAPSRDSVVVPSAHLNALPGQLSLQQHLAEAGLGAPPLPGQAGSEGGVSSASRSASGSSEDASLQGLVDALMLRLQQPC
jgi:hypothetical protein